MVLKGCFFCAIVFFMLIVSVAAAQNDQFSNDLNTIRIEKIECNIQNQIELDSVYYVPLETNEHSQFNRIDKVICVNDRIYIFDKTNKFKVYCFDIKGSYLGAVNSRGHREGRNIEINDFDVDLSNNIYILDGNNANILVYDSEFAFFKEITLTNHYSIAFKYFDDENIFLFLSDELFSDKIKHTVVKYNSINSAAEYFKYPFMDNALICAGGEKSDFPLGFNEDPCSKSITYSICNIDLDGVHDKYFFNFSNNIQIESNGIDHFETNHHLFFSFLENGKKWSIIFCKNDGRYYLTSEYGKISYSHNYLVKPDPIGVFGDFFIGAIDVSALYGQNSFRTNEKSYSYFYNSLNHSTQEIVDNVKEGDNPILFLYRLNEKFKK